MQKRRVPSARLAKSPAIRAGWAFGLLVAVLLAASPVHGSPASGDAHGPIFIYDLTPTKRFNLSDTAQRNRAYDEAQIVAALQGLVNREAPRLYVLFSEDRGLAVDAFWLRRFSEPGEWLHGREQRRIESIEALLEQFASAFDGFVVWDPSVPATSNVASTVAGADGLIPLRYDPNPGSLYNQIAGSDRFPHEVKQWLIDEDGTPLFTGEGTIPGTHLASSGSAKNDAYLWAAEHYLKTGASNPTLLANYLDAYWLVDPKGMREQHLLVNHDYLVAQRGFAFDLSPWADETPIDDRTQPLGTDRRTLESLLRTAYVQSGGDQMIKVLGFVPWAFKYTNYGTAGGRHDPVPSEWMFVEIVSAYNGYVEADAHGLDAMANASFFQHFPLQDRYEQPGPPNLAALQEQGFVDAAGNVISRPYVAYYGGDYDSPAWLYRQVALMWDDPLRGATPVNWAFNPNLADRAAPIMDYVRRTATSNDFFIAGDSGAGYVNPGLLDAPRRHSDLPAAWDAWLAHNQPYYDRWDLSITGFVIHGNAPPPSEEGWRTYALFSPDGYGAEGQLSHTGVNHGIPYTVVREGWHDNPLIAAQRIADQVRTSGSQFHMFRTILRTPTWFAQVSTELERRIPEVAIVDAGTLFQLIRIWEQGRRADVDFAQEDAVWIELSEPRREFGLYLGAWEDGPVEWIEVEGESALRLLRNPFGTANHAYFIVDDAFLSETSTQVTIAIEYLDQGTGMFSLQYDSANPHGGPLDGAYTGTTAVRLQNTRQWKQAEFTLPDARFAHRQNGGSDFRIVGNANLPLVVRRVEVRR